MTSGCYWADEIFFILGYEIYWFWLRFRSHTEFFEQYSCKSYDLDGSKDAISRCPTVMVF